MIGAIYSTAKLFKIFSEKVSVFSKKLCDIIADTLTCYVAYITLVGNVIIGIVNVGCRLSHRSFTYSSSFFRSSNGLSGFLLLFLLFLGLLRCCRSRRGSYGSRCGCNGSRCYLRHRSRRGSGRFFFGDLTISDVIHLVSKNHALTFFFRFLGRLFIVICKAHFILAIILVTVKVIGINGKNHIVFVFAFYFIAIKIFGIDGKNHIYGLFSGCFLNGSFFCYRLFSECFLNGSFFCYRLFSGCFFNGSFFCYRLFSRCFLYGSFLCYRLFGRCFLYGSFLCYRLFGRCFLYGSFFCYKLFSGCFLYGSLLCYRLFAIHSGFLLSLLLCEALFYFIKESSGIFSSATSLFLFLLDLFLDSLASSSLFLFLLLCKSGLFLSLLTLLSRSHRTLVSILLELLSVISSIIKGREPLLMQAL